MDPIKININVTLDASDKMLAAIQTLTGSRTPAAPAAPEHKPDTKPVEHKPTPAPETKEALAPQAQPEASEEISDAALRAIIKEVRDATSPAAVRGLFNEFGIRTSVECPMERRSELVARLKQLAA